jgi:hypothetical protein
LENNQPIGCIICEGTTEAIEFKRKEITKSGFLVAEGVIQRANELNRNRRYYPLDELAKGIYSKRTQELVSSGNFKGEAGHPTDTSLVRQAKVDPTNEQVWYKKIWMDGDLVKAHFCGTNNELGRSFNEDLKCGQLPSFSLRAVGSLINENGRNTVRNMQIITYDRVYWPAPSGAYTSHVITTESALGESSAIKQYDINENDYFYAKASEINRLSEAGNAVDSDEEIITPLTQKEMNNFIVAESANIRSVIDTFDVLYESMELDPTANIVTMKNVHGDTIVLSLESAVKKEILHAINDLF